ncbi:aldehyde dehydrogenase family protein [Epibacterium sp. SM1969]|uniref:Aldehyde dehydrogenase family protein n=1 Tax=Tritonibacter aquimaris TaxID=2663379 RepID=A0A844B3P9_9RHOB|nr:aldehyde dehydrogenase family protein [Tritonibacter aquimaris]MQY44006.1 aldehyde dehydrogenase family protein [Tritonibacter aquimaris]
MTAFTMTIGGQQVATADSFDVYNPSTGACVGSAPNGSAADLDAAVSAAQAAFETWSQKSDAELAEAVLAVAQKIEENAVELAKILTEEQGKTLHGLGSMFEMGGANAWAQHTASLSLPVEVLQDNEQGRIEQHRKPLGVVGSITPWNVPIMIAIWHVMPALRTGNTVVIKPSPLTPLSTLRMVQLANEVLPAGVLNCVSCDDKTSNLGAAMASHPDIRKIVFTGSTATGKKVMAAAADSMKRITLELGGNDAGIVLPDVDPKEIAEGLFWGGFLNNGQICAAMKRVYVHEDVYEAVCTELTNYAKNITCGDGFDETNALGPIANQMQFDKVSRIIEESKPLGRVLCGGTPGEGLFYPPTIIADLPHDAPLVQEEQFGPAMPLIKYSDIEEAIAAANATDMGLGGSVWSKDIAAAKKIASRLECGSVWINSHGMVQPNAPFGGVKSSGLGVEFGPEGLKEYTDIQVVFA